MAEIDRDSRPHTPTPWTSDGFEIRGKSGARVATATTHSNARRIAACANACSSVPNEELERGIVAELVFYCGKYRDDTTLAAILKRLGKLTTG